MSGTPNWDPEACGSTNESAKWNDFRPSDEFSVAEKELATASYKQVVESSQHLLNMPFMKMPNGGSLSEYYKNAGIFGVVRQVYC